MNLCEVGGQKGMCAWLAERHGVDWRIVPEALPRLLGLPDAEAVCGMP